MLDVHLVSDEHVRRYSIALRGGAGWEVRLEEDRTVRWQETVTDWHRVERMQSKLEREVEALLERGWRVRPVSR